MRIGAIIAVTAWGLASQATAQAASAFVECAWTDSRSGKVADTRIYRITRQNWELWSDKSWQYEPFSCGRISAVVTTKCTTTVTEDEYVWEEYGLDANPAYTAKAEQKFTIDRRTGAASFSLIEGVKPFDSPWKASNDLQQTGACKRVADPSLKPKPPPSL